MRLYRQKRATLGQQGRFYALVGSVPHLRKQGACLGRQVAKSLLRGEFYQLRKKKVADSQLIILMWKAEGFLLASDFLGGTKQNFFFSAGKYLGGEVRRGGRPGCWQGAPVPSPGFASQNLPRKRAHYPLGKGTFRICPCYWAIYIETRRKLLRSLWRKTGRKEKSGASCLGKPGGKPRFEP